MKNGMPLHSVMMRLANGRAVILQRRAWSLAEAIGDLESITTAKAIGTCDGCLKPLNDVSPYAIGSCADCENAGATRNNQQRKRRALRIANIKAERAAKASRKRAA